MKHVTGTRCVQCGRILAESGGFCSHCGARAASNRTLLCPYCNREIPRGRFCLHCGHMVTVACPSCHAELGSGERFCPQCGTEILPIHSRKER